MAEGLAVESPEVALPLADDDEEAPPESPPRPEPPPDPEYWPELPPLPVPALEVELGELEAFPVFPAVPWAFAEEFPVSPDLALPVEVAVASPVEPEVELAVASPLLPL